METAIQPTGNYVKQWIVVSQTNMAKKYKISQKEDGSWLCSCPSWIFKKKPKTDCKHIVGIKTSEPIDRTRTSAKAAEDFVRFAGRVPTSEPVFLLQTRRQIVLTD